MGVLFGEGAGDVRKAFASASKGGEDPEAQKEKGKDGNFYLFSERVRVRALSEWSQGSCFQRAILL